MVNDAGTVVNTYEYTPWGEIKNETEAIDNPIKYAGEYYDDELDMIYLRARYYDPKTGRFTSLDIEEGSISSPLDMNRYAYCRNNPIKYVDPTGYITEDEMNMYENGQMAPMAYSYLMHLTYQWYLADTAESKAVYNQWAEDFRATGYTTTNGEFPTVDEGIAYMPSRPNGGGAIPLSLEEHYFRNNLNLNFSWSEFEILQERLPDDMKWVGNVLANEHQNIKYNGIENRKYVSACGSFELIYNANNELQKENNNWKDMGTFNYYSPITNAALHAYYDWLPYKEYGNIPVNRR